MSVFALLSSSLFLLLLSLSGESKREILRVSPGAFYSIDWRVERARPYGTAVLPSHIMAV